MDEQGRARRIVGIDLDVTERKLFEEALFKEKESAQITLQSIGDGVITTDSKCRIEYLNPVAEQLTGWRLEHAQGRIVDEIFRSFHEETCEPLENPLAVAIRRTRAIKSVRPTLLIRRDGNELYIESCASPIRDGAGNVSGGVLVFHDVSESRELNRKLSYHASHDILTGLVNRREFESRLERAIKSARAREASYRAVPHRSRSVQDHQRQLRSQCRRCAARPGRARCSSRRSAGAIRSRGSAAMSSACCSRAVRSKRRFATPKRCARRSATTSSCGKSARSGSARASASCRFRRRTRTSPRCCPPRTAPAQRRRKTAAIASTASRKTTST